MVRSLVLFTHLVGMLTLFGGLGLEWLSVDNLRGSLSREQASPWMKMFAWLPRVYGISFGLILASGIYLAARAQVYDLGWVRISFGLMVLMGILGGQVVRSKINDIRSPVLQASLRVRLVLGLAAIYLMIGRLDAGKSLLVSGAALAVGAAASAWQWRSAR